MPKKKKCMKVVVCYTVRQTFHLPLKAKSYNPKKEKDWNGVDSIEAYLSDHDCNFVMEDSTDWQIVSCEEVEE
jgi:hypothetical protein